MNTGAFCAGYQNGDTPVSLGYGAHNIIPVLVELWLTHLICLPADIYIHTLTLHAKLVLFRSGRALTSILGIEGELYQLRCIQLLDSDCSSHK